MGKLTYTTREVQDRLDKVGTLVRPNLLDNWYFGNPVNQRNGYVVPPGTLIYNDTALTSLVGSAAKYYTVTAIGNSYNTIVSGTSNFYTPPNTHVRGYTGAGYTIDRWISDGGLLIEAGSVQPLAGPIDKAIYQLTEWSVVQALLGQTVTLSALYTNGTLESGSISLPSSIAEFRYIATQNAPNLAMVFDPNGSNQIFRIHQASGLHIIAVKLELGTQQTLAHQDANGNWVLNDTQDYGEELAKCQRYQEGWTAYIAIANVINDENAYGIIDTTVPFKVPKRGTGYAILYRSPNGTIGKVGRWENGWTDYDGAEMLAQDENGLRVRITGTPGGDYQFHYFIDANL